MKKERFAGKTLEEAEKKLAAWKSAHPTAVVRKKYPPVTTRAQSGAHPAKSPGSATSVFLNIDYEEQN